MKELIKKIMLEVGFAECGFAYFKDLSDKIFPWNRDKLPANPKSLIVALLPYYPGEKEDRNISLYAVSPDYHNIAMEKLNRATEKLKKEFPNNELIAFVDNSPINEKYAAMLSGLGVIGQNSLLINEKYGSYIFICEIVTDLQIDIEKENLKYNCKNCGLCVKSCPTNALESNRNNIILNKEKCISYINQKKGDLTPFEIEAIKKSPLIWGCDICQAVCPYNEAVTRFEGYEGVKLIWNIDKKDIENLTEKEFRNLYGDRAFSWRGKSVLLRNLKIKSE